MADNIAVTAGTGTTIAADDIGGGVLAQRVKTTWGPDGTANDADIASGKPLPVQLRSATGLIPFGEPTDAKSTATDTTSASAISILKQLSASLQSLVTALGSTALDLGSGTGGTRTLRAIFDSSQFSALGQTTKSASISTTWANDLALGYTITQPASATIARPADTTAYASGDLVANSTTAGSVTNLQFTTLARISGGSGTIVGAQIQKSSNVVTNAAFRLHLFTVAPTYVTSGDNTAMTTVVVASAKGYLGYIDISAMVGFSDVAWGSGAPDNSRGGIPYVAVAQIIYGLLEARGAYTPTSAEVFTVTLDALQD